MQLIDFFIERGYPLKREGRCYKTFSPFREEKNPSFAIYEDNTWYDFALSKGGDIIEFLKELYGSYKIAFDLVGKTKTGKIIEKKQPRYNIRIISPIKPTFFNYGGGIFVGPDEGAFMLLHNEKKYIAIPCPTKGHVEGLECRDPFTGERKTFFKKTIWFFRRSLLQVLICESIRDCIVAKKMLKGNFSLLAMNGVSNIRKTLNFINRIKPAQIFLALDNDKPGIQTQFLLENKFRKEGFITKDFSLLYKEEGVKDFFKLYEKRKTQ